MKFDVTVIPTTLNTMPSIARAAETYGFDGLWTPEIAHDPFLPLTHAASATTKINLGTAIAVAFPRSPMIVAHTAWDLAAQSSGRFILGLGTQIETHITKRFSTSWSAPVPRLREYIESLRAIWQSWQTGERLRYKGDHYQFTLMTPFFSPGPIQHPDIPIYIAGVNEKLCQLAGELCQGFHVHPFHTARYLKEQIIPNIELGADRAGRARTDVNLSCAIFVVPARDEREAQMNTVPVKAQIAFYASTPSYAPVLDLHGWGDARAELSKMARSGQWDKMGEVIDDTMLNAFAIIAAPEELAQMVKARYEGLLDRVGYYFPFEPDNTQKAPIWENAAQIFCNENRV
jgi:probable F420-dependent oxidoreductase